MDYLEDVYDFEEEAKDYIQAAIGYAAANRCEFLTPEILLLMFLDYPPMKTVAASDFLDHQGLREDLELYIREQLVGDNPEEDDSDTILLSEQCNQVMIQANLTVSMSSAQAIGVRHMIRAILDLTDSWAEYLFRKHLECTKDQFFAVFIGSIDSDEPVDTLWMDSNEEPSFGPDEELEQMNPIGREEETPASGNAHRAWRNLVTCISEQVEKYNPLIGREDELARTIQVLCRKDKKNVLHVGDPGVGKTALIYGLASLIKKSRVPEKLKGFTVYEMNMGSMVAGTQYRGDFEKRLKSVMDGICQEGKAIIYIDEIHNVVGAGRAEGSMDASNLLKPYLVRDEIRIIGSTTYEEFNRSILNDRAFMRRFQQVDILEPSVADSVEILKGLKKKYEEYHHVKYEEGAIEYAVEASAKYITDRCLPDKAIDLIDEAGAYRQLHPLKGKKQIVDKPLLSDVLCKICKVDSLSLKEENNEDLETIEQRILAKLYGQDQAVKQVVEAVQMAKAGLQEEDKPMASLLFVGPTGVGKTELCKVLAAELGIELVRFDMSEYAEKHTVAKLIGSPAGYVGYEDGGLLTDAIRKTPNCVLLLDEIEKADPDIFNILLQVMDYAKLTDNRGRKADFRHVVLVMTSNAGAQYAHQASLGFGSHVSAGSAMMTQVKKTFKPEFLNRLNGTVVFNDMDEKMAGMVLDKKLSLLQVKLTGKQVTMRLSDPARAYLMKKGFSKEYGAREMDRAIRNELTPLFMKQILFGELKKGGEATVVVENDQLALSITKEIQ